MSSDFKIRHIGPFGKARQDLLDAIGHESIDSLVDQVVPRSIQWKEFMGLPEALSESGALAALKEKFSKNRLLKPLIGQGYSGTINHGGGSHWFKIGQCLLIR